MNAWRRLAMMLDIVLHALLSAAKWGLPLAMAVVLLLFFQEVRIMATAVKHFFSWSQPKEPPKPLKERVADAKDKCRAYTMLADTAGSKSLSEQDKVRVLCTIIRLEETGVDPCDIFHLHKELVAPGWGRRTMNPYNPILKRYTHVPQRRFWYVEKQFAKPVRDAAELLGVRTKDQKLCPADWKAIVLIRPDSDDAAAANQTDAEKKAIKEKMVRQEISGVPSEFEFYRAP